ncbi:MAG: hypothetical protein ABSB82_02425 [Terriglobia bacterium]|jgi:hypothetical protein
MTMLLFQRLVGADEDALTKLAELLAFWWRLVQRALHALVGVIFLLLAGAGGLLSFSEWRRYREDPAVGLMEFGMVSGFTVLLTILSLYSFLKARSVR